MIMRCVRDMRTHPNSARPHVNLAIALLNRGRRDEGIAHLESALEYSPNDYVALTVLAAGQFNTGDLERARELYRRVIDLFPLSSSAYMGLASIALRQSDFLGAAHHLEKAIDVDSKLTAANSLLAMVYFKLGKPHQAIPFSERHSVKTLNSRVK